MKQEFIEEQKKIARDTGEQSINNTYYQYSKHELDTLISQTILATEGEMVKKVVDRAVELTNSHYGGASYQEGYRNACKDIISTLTNKV